MSSGTETVFLALIGVTLLAGVWAFRSSGTAVPVVAVALVAVLVVGTAAWFIKRSTGGPVVISGTVTHEFVSPGSTLGTALGYGSGQATCGTKAALGSLDVGDQTILVKDASGTIVGQAKTGPTTCAPSQSKSGGVSFKGVVVSAAFSVSVPRSGFYTFSLPPAQDVTVSLSQASQGVKIDTGIG